MSPKLKKLSALIFPMLFAATPVLADNKTADKAANAFAPIGDGTQFVVSDAGDVQAPEPPASEGDTFLLQNKSKPGVVTLADGLQYKVLEKGHGKKPGLNDVVTVDYAGTLIDGTEFDSSYKRGQPASFPVSGVIPGWTEALQMMPVGSTWELYIPANLAYGDQGAPPQIGPNQTLVFKVKLISIQKPA